VKDPVGAESLLLGKVGAEICMVIAHVYLETCRICESTSVFRRLTTNLSIFAIDVTKIKTQRTSTITSLSHCMVYRVK